MKLNNKGFTLVELLAVLVILVAISAVAIPAISSSMDRNKEKQYKAKVNLVVIAAELFVSDHIDGWFIFNDFCYVSVSDLIKYDYIEEDDDISKYSCVKYTPSENSYKFVKEDCYWNSCVDFEPR